MDRPAVGERALSSSRRSAIEAGFESRPLLFGSPAPGRFEEIHYLVEPDTERFERQLSGIVAMARRALDRRTDGGDQILE